MSHARRFMWVALALPIVICAMAASAFAKEPTGNFAVFKQCPTNNPAVNLCFVAASEGGVFQVGKVTVPVVKTQTLQGGSILNEETGAETFVGAENGESLLPVAQVVPGGIVGLTKASRFPQYFKNFCANFPENVECKVTATAELAGQPGISRVNLLFQEGTALFLPLKLHLKNPYLGGKCYVGTNAEPLQIHYTTGTTNPPKEFEPLMGRVGELEFTNEFTNILVKHNLVVDNTFTAPGAVGCGGPAQEFLVDREIDIKNGLPASAGHNKTELFGTLYNATAEAVKLSE